MTVTELAILHLFPDTAVNKDSPLLENLRLQKAVQTSLSGYTPNYFIQVEDPSIIYIIGTWDSPEAHSKAIESEQNQNMIALLSGQIDFEDSQSTFFHVDLDGSDMNLCRLLNEQAIGVTRYFVKAGAEKGWFKKVVEESPEIHLITDGHVAGGWRMDKERLDGVEREEWVEFTGCEDLEIRYRKSTEAYRHHPLVDLVDGIDAKHMRMLKDI